MNIKKIFILYCFMMSSIACPCDFQDIDIKSIAVPGLAVSTTAFVGYLITTAGDSVEQRVFDAEEALATMAEYEQEFEIDFIFQEKESQIKSNLNLLNINLHSLNNEESYDVKLQKDLVTLGEVYNNLWFKSFCGGEEIVAITRKVYEYKVKVKALLKYFQEQHKFIDGYKIINESYKLLSRNSLQDQSEIMKAAKIYDPDSTYPLFNYVRKLKKDLECIKFLTTEKKALQDYPELSAIIIQHKPRIEEVRDAIIVIEAYKQEALSKLEYDVALLTERQLNLELLIKQLQFEIQMLRMSQR